MSTAPDARRDAMGPDATWPDVSRYYAPDGAAQADARPLWLARGSDWARDLQLDERQTRWLSAHGFKPAARRPVVVPAANGDVGGIAMGADALPRDPMTRAEIGLGAIAPTAPPGTYRLHGTLAQPELAAVAWGLGAYTFARYKTRKPAADSARLHIPANAHADRVRAIVEAVHFGRDLVNTPSSDMGPADLERVVHVLAARHGATVEVVIGDDLLTRNFPMIHAVGRASTRAPRLIDLRVGREGPRVTLVGKGICFDTGGLDLKPSSGMLLMKKDMGGAAAVLALAHMIMAAKLKVRLRVLIAAAENSVAGNAFRPGDVLATRAGLTVEIGNTDAEGRLVLADALTLADAEKPDLLISMATLTGAARTALGAELAPFYCDDDGLAGDIAAAGLQVADPAWRMPFWTAYEPMFDSPIADINNVSESGFAGSVIAALFLRRFVTEAARYAHFDIYGWRPGPKPLGPKGGEVHGARALFEVVRKLG